MIIQNLSCKIDNKNILTNISFQIGNNQTFALLGHNGSGKTSLLKCIMGLLKSEGNINFKEKNIENMEIYERAILGIGYILQEIPEYLGITVEKYMKSILLTKFNVENITNLFDKFGLDYFSYKNRNFDSHLSGGERKKIEIITSFLLERDIYLLDEIETSLDANSRQVLIDFIKQKSNTSFIIVSHNQDMIKLADEALLLCNGKIQQIGILEEINKIYLGKCEDCKFKNNCKNE